MTEHDDAVEITVPICPEAMAVGAMAVVMTAAGLALPPLWDDGMARWFGLLVQAGAMMARVEQAVESAMLAQAGGDVVAAAEAMTRGEAA